MAHIKVQKINPDKAQEIVDFFNEDFVKVKDFFFIDWIDLL